MSGKFAKYKMYDKSQTGHVGDKCISTSNQDLLGVVNMEVILSHHGSFVTEDI